MQGWWGAPDYQVPTCRWLGNGEERAMTTRTRCKHEHLKQHLHSSTAHRSQRLYLRSVCFEVNRFIEEVVIHGLSREVVVLSVIGDPRDGSEGRGT